MDQLSWTGSIGNFLDPIFLIVSAIIIILSIMSFVRGFGLNENRDTLHWQNYVMPTIVVSLLLILIARVIFGLNLPYRFSAGESSTFLGFLIAFLICLIPSLILVWAIFKVSFDFVMNTLRIMFFVWLALALVYLVLGVVLPRDSVGIIGNLSKRMISVWISLIVLFALSIRYKSRLGFYGRIFDSTFGMVGFGLVMFWVFASFYSGVLGWIATHDVLTQIFQFKDTAPGVSVDKEGVYPYYLLGGDHFGRDVFSRTIVGSWEVIKIAPFATLVAFMVGITLGLPAGYYGGRVDTVLSFVANLVLAFPVILLFYLLVTPEIAKSGIPIAMAAFMFIFPIIFLIVLINSRYFTKPKVRNVAIALIVVVLGWVYLSALSRPETRFEFLPSGWDKINPAPEMLTVFISVVFVNSPTVFRIVRGLTLDIKSRDYVGAAQTRGERPWYIMLWEILPNVRGPLIVDFCLRIGYVTILLGTLGFLGLGLPPDSPDWGTTIAEGSKYLRITPFPPLPPALALISLVLGLNLLADGLREESLKD